MMIKWLSLCSLYFIPDTRLSPSKEFQEENELSYRETFYHQGLSVDSTLVVLRLLDIRGEYKKINGKHRVASVFFMVKETH